LIKFSLLSIAMKPGSGFFDNSQMRMVAMKCVRTVTLNTFTASAFKPDAAHVAL
jgi:hypothetical protein